MNIETSNAPLAGVFKALGDPTRLGIFQALRCCAAQPCGMQADGVEVDEEGQVRPSGSLSVGEVCCRIGGSNSTISHHLKELRLAGLIRMEKRGRWIYCSINPEALRLIRGFVEEENASCQPTAAPRMTACC